MQCASGCTVYTQDNTAQSVQFFGQTTACICPTRQSLSRTTYGIQTHRESSLNYMYNINTYLKWSWQESLAGWRKHSQELLKGKKGRGQLKLYLQLPKSLYIRDERGIVVGIKPVHKRHTHTHTHTHTHIWRTLDKRVSTT